MKKIFNHFLLISMVCATPILLKASEAPLMPAAPLEQETSAQKKYRDSHWGTQLADLEKAVNKKVYSIENTLGKTIQKMIARLAKYGPDEQKNKVFMTTIRLDRKEIGKLCISMPKKLSHTALNCNAFIHYLELKTTCPDLYEFVKSVPTNTPINSCISQRPWFIERRGETIIAIRTHVQIDLNSVQQNACLAATNISTEKALDYMTAKPNTFPSKQTKKRKKPSEYTINKISTQ